MADNESTDAFEDELLSAYVDGELDEDERALVEQRLREDPRAKQWVDELQGLSETLRALPREQIGRELREEVLQQIEEKAILLASPKGGWNVSRRWIWAAIAIAATLALMVYQPDVAEEERQLAKAKPLAEEPSVSALQTPAAADLDRDELEVAEFGDEDDEEIFLIHLTLADARTGQLRFNELLASNRIDLQAESSEEVAIAGRGATALSSREIADQPDAVLVEASPVQIESLLKAFSADTKNWNSLSFEEQKDSSFPVARWRSLERKGKRVAKSGAIRAFSESEDEAKPYFFGKNDDRQPARQKAGAPRGRATRLGTDWFQLHEFADGKGRANRLAKEDLAVENSRGAQPSSSTAQIQVLFVLHRAKSSSKKAMTSK